MMPSDLKEGEYTASGDEPLKEVKNAEIDDNDVDVIRAIEPVSNAETTAARDATHEQVVQDTAAFADYRERAKQHIEGHRAAGLQAQILRELPKDKPITVMALMGDGEGIQFAHQIHAFMRANGFMMKEPDGISQGVFSGPIKGLQRRDEKDGSITFIVGPNLP
jgi:hypothetical protein